MPKQRTNRTVILARLKEVQLERSNSLHASEGMPPKEIRLRIRLSGPSIASFASFLRRSTRYIHQVINRERRSDYVESAITRLLAWQGFTRGDIWGSRRAIEPESIPGTENPSEGG